MTVLGDFEWEEMAALLDKKLGEWRAHTVHVPTAPKVETQYDFLVNYINKPDTNQSYIRIGHMGGLMNDPDYPALRIMSDVLSMERMFRKLNKQEGLYWAGGDYGFWYTRPGTFFVGSMPKSESTVRVLRTMLGELKHMREFGVSDHELELYKKYALNGFVFESESKAQIVGRLSQYNYFKFPRNFLETVMARMEKVTKADVLRAIRTHLHPDKVRILVVGNQAKFDEPLSVLGKVNTIDISIPADKPAGQANN